MNNPLNRPITTDAIFLAMREFLIAIPPTEVDPMAREAGVDLQQLARAGRSAADSAIQQSKQPTRTDYNVLVLHKALNSLLVMLRRRDNLDEAELAQKANVDETEIRRIEFDSAYLPSPRTIYNLEKAFALPAGVLAKLSGAIKHHSPLMEQRVTQFAANSKSMGKLTKAERQILNAFVNFLAEQ